MKAYAARRLASAVLVAAGVTVGTFALLHVEPGDPARLVLGEHAPPSAVAALRRQWGLDRSLPHQFVRFIGDLIHGNLGRSYIDNTSAASLIGQRAGLTLALVATATLFSMLITVPLAAAAAARRNGLVDHAVRTVSVVGIGMPSFWFGIILIEVLALRVHVFPVGGWGTSFSDHLRGIVLPGLTAAFGIIPILVRSLRVGMIEVLDADFVATVRGKGIGERRVLFAHVARNAVVPTLTLLGVNIAYLIGTTVVVEQVFALNGLGSLLVNSITDRDFPVVQSITLILAAAVVVINLATDLLIARLDPRIRLE